MVENSDINVYVPFETAKLMRSKGFDCLMYSHYTSNGELVTSDYKAMWVTPAPTHGQALEWLRRKNVYTSFYVEKCAETGKDTWAFQYFDRDLNLIATDSGINITNYNKCVELAIMFATKFLVR